SVRELAAAVTGAAAALPPIVAGPRPAQLPLSFAQQRMWFLNQFTESAAPAASYNIPFAVRLVASDAAHRIDPAAVAAAVHDVMARHETLRTRFRQADDGAVTAEIADAAAAFDSIGWAELSAADENAAYRTAAEWATRPFDVAREFPVRGGLIDLGAGEVVLVLVLHHIAADGESMAPLLTDLLTAYAARTAGQAPAWEPLPVQYADYALWQRAVLGDAADASSIAGAQLDYWRDRLAGLPDVLDLPTDFARPAVATMAGGSVAFTLPGTVRSAVADLARAHGTTEFAVLHAAIASLLARLSGTDDIAVGTPIAGRGQSVLDPVVGMFVNTLVLRTRIDSGKSFADTVADTAAVDLAALSHSDVPFEHVVEAVNPVRSEAFVPLAQTLFTFDQHDPEPMAVDGLLVEPVDAGAESAKADLNFVVARDADGGYAGRLVFATDLFTATTAQSIADRFVTLLTSAVASVSTPVGDIDLRSSAEVQAQAELPAPVCETVNADRSLVELFTAAAMRRAAATAVTAQGSSVTYSALVERSDAIAAGLVARGVRAGDLVGVATGRSTDLVASILGVLKAGAAYVPLDTSNPAERLAFIVADSGVHVVLTDASVADHDLWSTVGDSVSVLDVADLNAEGAAFAPVSVPADAAAYVIYTSGSTGRPKGVVVSHRDVVTLMDTAAGDFEFRDDDVWTMFHSYAFDFTVWELWGPLLSGARLVIVDRDLARDPVAFLTLLSDEGVSVLSQTPSAFYQLSEARRDFRGQLSLRYVVFGGEELGFEQVRRWFDAFPDDTAQLVNMYGITETTVHVSFRALDRATVSAGDGSFIGRPLASLAIHILDDRMHPVPAGVPGEMYVSGGQLAHGYLHRSGLTSTRFVADPFGPAGSRLYRTGDLARRVGDDIEYLGRGDAQVQLRGFRIEYGEIEAALLGAAGVSGAAARVVEVPGRGELLIGYVVGDDGDEIDPSSVRSAVGRAVPGYMVPDQVVAVDTLPLTANGKLDRKALPIPESLTGLGEFVAPVGDIEAGIAAVFADVLGLEQVSVVESFFDLGGNSLSATRVVARVGQALDAHVSVRDLFTNPSVRELAATVDAGTGALAPITAQPRPDRVPLSFAQQRLWFLNRLNPGDATYNVPIALRLTGALDVAALRAAVVDVVARHEVLRTTFPEIDGEAFQLVHPIDEIESSLPWTVVTSREEIEAQATRGFDLTAQWPLRIVLWPISETEHVLAAISQHIAMDGESLRPLVTDVITAYAARAAGQTPAFAPLAVQFADFALWQHRVLGSAGDPDSVVSKQLAYWTEQLAGLPGVLEFPTDRHRPLVASGRGANLMTALPATTAAAIVDYAHARRVTPFMVMHAALAATMSRIAGADDIAIATPVAGRGDAVLDPLVGMFVNTLVLRASVDGGAGFDALVRQVADTDVAAFAHADVPFEAVVDAVDPVRSEAFAPLAQVQLNFDPGAGAADSVDIAGLAIAPVDTAVTRAQLDLYLTVQTGGEDQDWNLNLIYATDLFDEPRIRRLLDTLVGVLDQVLADPMAPIGDLQILDESERRELEAFEHGPIVEFDQRLLTEVIAEQVSVSPEAVALVFGEREVSYREFGARVATLARELIGLGVGPDVTVALCMPRSVEMVVAIHAVVAAGGQYMPIAVDAPDERAEYMLEVTGSALLLVTDRDLVSHVIGSAQQHGLPVVSVDASGAVDLAAPPVTDAERTGPLRLENPMYTLFTSGSTGRPKGVTTQHRGINNRLWWGVGAMPIDETDRVVLKSPYTFDVSIAELFAPLMVGARIVILAPDVHLDPLALADEFARAGVTTTHFVPSMMSVFLDICGQERVAALTSLRIISTTGEALPPAMAATVRRWLPETMLVNLYGPTEASIEISGQHVEHVSPDDPSVPIGSVVSNGAVAVLDRRLRRVPVGTAGELYIGGVQVGRGYAGRADLTADRYVADPFGEPGARMYRTGDLVRWNARGELEYLGRTDFQVKLRGQRVELGEIETVISSVPGVVHTAATVLPSATGDQLVAWVSPASAIDMAEMEARLAEALPVYMRPTAWVVMDEMPLNPSGKVNRGVLPAPEFEVAEYVAPEGEREELVAGVFADVLGADRVSVTGSFFDLGGNSLSATRVAARVGQVLGVSVSVRDVFDAPSIRELAAVAATKGSALAPIAAVVPR
ncbi:MAG: amino acid adenylation domain-containing protein, partial [Gordonia sp. (in: high G+C Gram-positive bacteria)]|uniref:amino acid adenylation domain-containing protein n=1 Tax=Gordonia sp. (in: high G+C Gram-positive bacteria) TaxID=84139 RepID=UPI003C739F5B